jgi:hypothetical protein
MIYHHSRTAGWYPSAFAHGQHVDAGRTVKGAPYFFEDDSERELHEGAFLPYLRVRGRTHLPGYQPPITMLLPACDELVTIRWAQGTRRAATSEAHAPAVIGLHAQRHKKSRRTCCARLLTVYIIPSRGTVLLCCQLTRVHHAIVMFQRRASPALSRRPSVDQNLVAHPLTCLHNHVSEV